MTCIIFDCDGVLIESEAISIDAEMDFLAVHGLVVERNEYIRAFMGTSKPDWLAGVT